MFNIEATRVVLVSAELTRTMNGAETDGSGLGAVDITTLVNALRSADIYQVSHQFLDDAMARHGD
ncbi:MAG: hypothetical protein P4L92_02580 [Rudaea sp.]|nr:hypothetical protein [Rudaea sp.]